ncbi:MAG: ferrous iron transport protein B, partial [Prevotellaceae bacterium]|nr:ferrous iron transport protein B [Prevotellaceae bacterium]
GEKGVIIKVLGHGGFRKRIVEMGFIKGKVVEVLLNAPLKDPIKYKVMGYEISLRRQEAGMIEILSEQEAGKLDVSELSLNPDVERGIGEDTRTDDDDLERMALSRRRTINVALVGNPNCGKTSLFNVASGAHERVGNYGGVTVDAKDGWFDYEGYHFRLIDLPGTYSLSAYSPEEVYVRHHIIDKTPDIIINVVDASNLERNLYLTTQLIDMNVRMVIALNMYDELEQSGNKLDHKQLGKLLGAPVIPTVGHKGKGIDELFHTIIRMYEEGEQAVGFRHIHISHGAEIERSIEEVKRMVRKNEDIRSHYSTRFLSIKLLENDRDVEKLIKEMPGGEEILRVRDEEEQRLHNVLKVESEQAITDAKYGFIAGAMRETFVDNHIDTNHATRIIDSFVTNRVLGFPLFFIFLFVMFWVTFTVGQYPMDWIDAGVGAIGDFLEANMPEGILKAMIVDGIIAGVGAVIGFLPQILILYLFISFMEDCGYMARAAFIMDKVMHKIGLHGKSFIPFIMGFGCNVPAVMATRTIENRRNRLVTMLILPMMSCSARWPVYVMMVGAFFAVKYQSLVMLALYICGFIVAALMSLAFSKWLVKGDDTPFVMELPPYRFPTRKAIFRHTWEKGKQYLKKMGTIILVASIVVWALGYFPHHEELDQQEQQEQSYIGRMGKAIEPIFSPQGFDWKLDVSLIAGVGAKEIVASTIGILYINDDSVAEEEDSDEAVASDGDEELSQTEKYQVLREAMEENGITPRTAFAYLLFTLLYFPCIATIAAIKGETGSWKWTIFAAAYTTVVAWVVSALFYQIGGLFV